jgi:hypothetical protein
MGAKFKSTVRHIYLIGSFYFWRGFFARLASKFQKSTNMTKKKKKKIFNQKRYQKTQNFKLISNPLNSF